MILGVILMITGCPPGSPGGAVDRSWPAPKSGHSADAAGLDWVLSIVYGVAPAIAARFADTVVHGGESPHSWSPCRSR